MLRSSLSFKLEPGSEPTGSRVLDRERIKLESGSEQTGAGSLIGRELTPVNEMFSKLSCRRRLLSGIISTQRCLFGATPAPGSPFHLAIPVHSMKEGDFSDDEKIVNNRTAQAANMFSSLSSKITARQVRFSG